MAGGTGVEYYFGYKLPQNDLNAEDWRSRTKTWKYSAIALGFFHKHEIPFWEMASRNELIGADPKKNEGYCLAKPGEVYLVYLPTPQEKVTIDLTGQGGAHTVHWFNPREGGDLVEGPAIRGGGKVSLPAPPSDQAGDDWLAVIRPEPS